MRASICAEKDALSVQGLYLFYAAHSQGPVQKRELKSRRSIESRFPNWGYLTTYSPRHRTAPRPDSTPQTRTIFLGPALPLSSLAFLTRTHPLPLLFGLVPPRISAPSPDPAIPTGHTTPRRLSRRFGHPSHRRSYNTAARACVGLRTFCFLPRACALRINSNRRVPRSPSPHSSLYFSGSCRVLPNDNLSLRFAVSHFFDKHDLLAGSTYLPKGFPLPQLPMRFPWLYLIEISPVPLLRYSVAASLAIKTYSFNCLSTIKPSQG